MFHGFIFQNILKICIADCSRLSLIVQLLQWWSYSENGIVIMASLQRTKQTYDVLRLFCLASLSTTLPILFALHPQLPKRPKISSPNVGGGAPAGAWNLRYTPGSDFLNLEQEAQHSLRQGETLLQPKNWRAAVLRANTPRIPTPTQLGTPLYEDSDLSRCCFARKSPDLGLCKMPKNGLHSC